MTRYGQAGFVGLLVASVLLGGCVLSADSFEPWEPMVNEYLEALGVDARSSFADNGHAIAYALAVDCFAAREPASVLEVAVGEACRTSEGLLSDAMTMSDLCEFLGRGGNVGVAAVNGGQLCGG